MSRSKREIPHYYLEDSVPMRHATAWLTECNAQRSVVDRLLPTVLQIKAVAVAAARYGEFNGFWRDGEFRASDDVHVGVAISLRGGGLVAPAIHDVPAKSLDQLMAELSDLVLRARAGTLRSSEMSDPTITVTSLGDKGVRTVFGVIYPPQVALVGFGKVTPQVCVVDDGIHIMESMQITLAADHRASDGHRGALFLSAVNQLLQEPESLAK
jgi:pyruvate dehydrogenase E2 component (dihydrolipoamide acetyltransferase)